MRGIVPRVNCGHRNSYSILSICVGGYIAGVGTRATQPLLPRSLPSSSFSQYLPRAALRRRTPTTRPFQNPFAMETPLPSARHPSSVTSPVLAGRTTASSSSSSDASTGVICRAMSSSRGAIKSLRVFQQRLDASCRRGSALGGVASTHVPLRTITEYIISKVRVRVRVMVSRLLSGIILGSCDWIPNRKT